MEKPKKRLRAGDWVQVRSSNEILKTLDVNGHLDGLPFMPEMFQYCGRKFQVYKRAHKTCDPFYPVTGRWVDQCVHLDLRCDGNAHDGCQAGCLIFWKEVWLKPISAHAAVEGNAQLDSQTETGGSPAEISEETAKKWTRLTPGNDQAPKYVCQATQLLSITKRIDWWDPRQYIEDYTSGNVSIWRLICGFFYSTYYNLSQAGIGLGPAMAWFYDRICFLWGGSLFPRRTGTIPAGQPTPSTSLNLQPGELVRIKAHSEILRTLDTSSRNRGLLWDAEMSPFCGGTYRVLSRVSRIIDEKSATMVQMKNPCIVLDSVFCQSRYSGCRMFCPRGIYSYWREIWLERVNPISPK